jgi:hypothetical protein
LLAASALAFKDGERVLGRFGGYDYWYPATVTGSSGAETTLAYEDGSTETVDSSRIRQLVWNKAMPVECQFDEDWKRGTITKMDAATLTLTLEDGSSASSPAKKCRTQYPPEDPEEAKKQAAAAAQMSNTIQQMGNPKRLDEDKVDCNKLEAVTDTEAAQYDANPLAAIAAKANNMCTFIQRVYQNAKPGKGPSSQSKFKGVSKPDALTLTKGWWEGSSDNGFVKVLGARVTGAAWKNLEMSDVPGLPSSRVLAVEHIVSYRGKCFLVFGAVKQNNTNHPDRTRAPAWSRSEYDPSAGRSPEKIDCKKGAGF